MTPDELLGPLRSSMLELMGALCDFPEHLPAARRRWSAFKRAVQEMSASQPPLWAHDVLNDIYRTSQFRIFRALTTKEAKQTPAYKTHHREYMKPYMRKKRATLKKGRTG